MKVQIRFNGFFFWTQSSKTKWKKWQHPSDGYKQTLAQYLEEWWNESNLIAWRVKILPFPFLIWKWDYLRWIHCWWSLKFAILWTRPLLKALRAVSSAILWKRWKKRSTQLDSIDANTRFIGVLSTDNHFVADRLDNPPHLSDGSRMFKDNCCKYYERKRCTHIHSCHIINSEVTSYLKKKKKKYFRVSIYLSSTADNDDNLRFSGVRISAASRVELLVWLIYKGFWQV